MKHNVYMKSMLRQPVRTFILALLVALAAFAIISRWVEYVIVVEETARLEELYRPAGRLQNLRSLEDGVAQGVDIIAESPYLHFGDRRRFAQGVTVGHTPNISGQSNLFTLEQMMQWGIFATDVYFYGTVNAMYQEEFQMLAFGEGDNMMRRMVSFYVIEVSVDETLAGLRGHVPIGQQVRLLLSVDDTFPLMFWSLVREHVMDAIPYDAQTDFPDLDLRIGQQYFFRATHFENISRMVRDGRFRSGLVMMPLDSDGSLWYLPATADLEVHPYILEGVELANINQQVLQIVTTKDMRVMPMMERVGHDLILTDGRWLNHEDYQNANPVVVMNAQMATWLDLRLGDSVTMDIRDFQSHFSSLIPRDYEDWRDYPVITIDLEIVGLYRHGAHAFATNHIWSAREAFVPDSVLPAGFGVAEPGMERGFVSADAFSFALNSPRDQAAFIAQHEGELSALGLQLIFRDASPEEFVASVDTLMMSLTVNLWIFSAMAVVILALAVFIYLRQARRNFAIIRALGCPARRAVRQSFMPALLLWLPFGLVGSVIAWQFGLTQAGESLHTLMANAQVTIDRSGVHVAYQAAELSLWWLVGLCTGIFMVIFAAMLIGIVKTSRKPVLELLQDQQTTKDKRRKAKSSAFAVSVAESGEIPTLGVFVPSSFVDETNPSRGYRAEVKRILRQIRRAPAKTLLTAGVALAFVFGLGWMQHTMASIEAELERLYASAEVTVELRAISAVGMNDQPLHTTVPAGDVIRARTINAIMATGFVQDAYLVASSSDFHLLPPLADGSFPVVLREGIMADPALRFTPNFIYAFNGNIDVFLYRDGQGEYPVIITYGAGFGSEDFVYDADTEGYVLPAILHENTMRQMGLDHGDVVFLSNTSHHFAQQSFQIQIIGSYIGTMARDVPIGRLEEAILMPLSAFEAARGVGIRYVAAYFYIYPHMNQHIRELDEFMRDLTGQVTRAGLTLLRGFIYDGGLSGSAEPLEQNLVFLQILYPITISLAFVIGAGLAGLIVVQNAKIVAVLRVLGATRRATRIVLCAELLMVSILGIILALGIMLAMRLNLSVQLALVVGLYLAGTLIGVILGAVLISRRAPIELLQVKE